MLEQEFAEEELRSERWLPAVNYEAEYSVSSLGRVRRELATSVTWAGRIRKTSTGKDGYVSLRLCKNGKCRNVKVHKLVALAFLGERPSGLQVNHKDCCKANNRVENLEYCTPVENMRHAHQHGLVPLMLGDRNGSRRHPERRPRGDTHFSRTHPEKLCRGENHPKAKLKDSDIPRIFELQKSGLTQPEIGAIVGVTACQVGRILRKEARDVSR